MNVIVVIPARYDSTRFPGKALFDIKGKALVHHVYDNIVDCTSIDKCIVATDSDDISNYCIQNNIDVRMTSSDHINGTERVAEIACQFDKDDIIINIQGDEPLVNCEHVNKLVELMKSDNLVDIATLGRIQKYTTSIDDPNLVKIVCDKDQNALYFSRSAIPYKRDKSRMSVDDVFIQHIGMYAFRAGVLSRIVQLPESNLEKLESLEQLRWIENGFRIQVGFTKSILIGIDTPEDVAQLLAYWKNN